MFPFNLMRCLKTVHVISVKVEKTYQRANNVVVKKILSWVKSLQILTLSCLESE